MVIGVVAGLALVVGAAIWCVRRRHKMDTKPLGWEPTNELPEKPEPGVHNAEVGELPVSSQKAELRELPISSQKAELSTQNTRHELL